MSADSQLCDPDKSSVGNDLFTPGDVTLSSSSPFHIDPVIKAAQGLDASPQQAERAFSSDSIEVTTLK